MSTLVFLMDKMGRNLGMRLPHITTPPFYTGEGEGGGGGREGGREGAGSENKTKLNSKCGSGPEEVGHCILPYIRDQILEPVYETLLVAVL